MKDIKLYHNILKETDVFAALIFGYIINEAKSQKTNNPIKSQVDIIKDLGIAKNTLRKKIELLENLDYFKHKTAHIKNKVPNPYMEGYFDTELIISTEFQLTERAMNYLKK
jgi:hypothetical protein